MYTITKRLRNSKQGLIYDSVVTVHVQKLSNRTDNTAVHVQEKKTKPAVSFDHQPDITFT